MKEKLIEQALVKAVKHKGGLCLKLVSPSLVGIQIVWFFYMMDVWDL